MIYIVTFEIHQNCQIHSFVYHTEARNAQDACTIAKQAWAETDHTGHMFHLHAVKHHGNDIDLLHVVTWKGTHLHGSEVMRRFFSTDVRTWRVSGRNLYSF